MSRRPGVVVVAAVLSLVAALGPGLAAQAQNGAEAAPGITVTAAPRWGSSTPGRWTTYLVTARNDGTRTFDGEALLDPVPGPPPPPLGVRPKSVGVVAVGATQFSVEDKAGAASVPSSFPTYRSPLTLAGGSEKTLTMLAVEAPNGYRAELRDRSGRPVAASLAGDGAAGGRPGYNVALLSDADGAEASLGNLRGLFAPTPLLLTTVRKVQDLPDQGLQLSGLHAVVLDRFDTGALTTDQVRALSDFVGLGGTLVVGGGPDGLRTVAGLPAALVPLQPAATATVSLAPLGDLVAHPTSATAAVTTGELRSGRPVLASEGVPLVVQADQGAGRVIQLAYDPLAEVFAADPVLRDLAWQQGVARGLAAFTSQDPGPAPPQQLWAPAIERRGWPRWPRPALWLLAAYGVAAAPLGYGLLRVRRRGLAVWAVVPLVAVAALAVAGLAGEARRGTDRRVVEVHRSVPGGSDLTTSYLGFPARGRGDGPLGSTAAVGAATTVFVAPAVVTPPAPPGPSAVGGAGGGRVSYAAGAAKATRQAEPGEIQNLQLLSLEPAAGLASRLSLVGAGAAGAGPNRIVGTVTNGSARPLRQLRVQRRDGALARVAEEIGPGQTIQVDAPVVAATRGPAGSGLVARPEEMIMFAAAGETLLRDDQVAVVGLDQLNPAPASPEVAQPIQRVSVVVEVAALERSEDPEVTGAQLVARVADPQGFGRPLAVYDLGGLPGLGSLSLVYMRSETLPVPEVYDWTTGTWRPAPTGKESGEGAVPLTPGEVNDGLVRIRARVGANPATLYRLKSSIPPLRPARP